MLSERDELQTIISMLPANAYLSRSIEGNMGIQQMLTPDPATTPRMIPGEPVVDSEGNETPGEPVPALDEDGQPILDTLPLLMGEWISFDDFKKANHLFQYSE